MQRFSLGVLVLSSTGLLLFAQPANNLRLISFNSLDRNRDHFIERQEWPADQNTFNQLDTNRDGRLSAEEYFTRGQDAERSQRFYAWDKNHDGFIEGNEWQSGARLFHILDFDGDSRISYPEFMSHDIPNEARFQDLDVNKDGKISPQEWDGTPAEFTAADLDHNGFLSPEEYFVRGGQQAMAHRFQMWDKNKDGQIEGNEWRAPGSLFHKLDTDRNSVVSRAEFMAANRTFFGSTTAQNIPRYAR